ncbi:sensor histidine kinase [Streptomyces sp.]|uniref:sensor histidine kinase n=1 Tax=Streptomyces sp. TaxID=1931 RepID=UPI002D7681C5|nr:sensor histidine kinase [Streptomyces sp.]HET6357129.1 sensor histidine kinase [Streptomyces sp.]
MNEETFVRIARPPTTRRQAAVKLLWICIWLAFMGAPVSDLLRGEHTARTTALGWLGLVSFVAVYLVLVYRHTSKPVARTIAHVTLAVLFALAAVLTLSLGSAWLVLFVYVSVSAGATLPLNQARVIIPGITAAMVLIGLKTDNPGDVLPAVVIPALLGGFALTGVRQMVVTTKALREARATVAQLAANEERLRLARDLHDLLGHSLSLITLKSELAGRMLPGQPERAAQQIADIEKVSRQALVDVREAVTGYRRPTLPGELAGARTALAAAGITAEVPADAPEIAEQQEAALAWSLREAVTNVVRHSGAHRCVVALTPRQTLDGPVLELTVQDNGRGGSAAFGNGLTGLSERITDVGGTVDTGSGRGSQGGFTLTVRVPLGSAS